MPFFKTSKHLFQLRFHLSISPDCKMCVRVTNTGEVSKIWGSRHKHGVMCCYLAHSIDIFVRERSFEVILEID